MISTTSELPNHGDEVRVPAIARIAVTIGAPLLLTLAFPKISFGPAALFALAPLFWLWSKSSWRDASLLGWASGTLFCFVMLSWMTNSLGDYIGGWKIVAGIALALFEGLSFAAVGALTALVCRGIFGARAIAAAAAAWLLVESIRTRGAFGVPFGELGLTAAHMPWLLPVAAYAGVYGLTAAIALCNASLAGLAGGSRAGRIAGAATLAGLVVLVAAADVARGRVPIERGDLDVAIAQGDISQREKWSPQIFDHTLTVYSDLTRAAAQRGAKIVVWPETAVTSYPLQEPPLLGFLTRLAQANGVWLVAGTLDRPDPRTLYNSVIAISPRLGYAARYDKHILVPFAEYLPFDSFLRGVPLFDQASQFVPGPGPTLVRAQGFRFGVLVCYESAFAPYAREVANAGADAFIVVTDDAWFGDTSGPYQHADMSVVDAVQTGRWVIRGADTGISEIIDPKGEIVKSLPLDQEGTIAGRIGPPIDAPYRKIGVWWLLVLAGLALVIGLVPRPGGGRGWRSRRGRY
jgi:apolipoprotein N-acyltransferase